MIKKFIEKKFIRIFIHKAQKDNSKNSKKILKIEQK